MKGHKIRWKTKSGFTLLEVVVALAILGMGLMVILELFAGGLRSSRISQEYTKAAHYGRMILEEIDAKSSVEEGEGMLDETYRWQTAVKRWNILPVEKEEEFSLPVGLVEVKVRITWKSGSKERSIEIESFRTVKAEDHEKKS